MARRLVIGLLFAMVAGVGFAAQDEERPPSEPPPSSAPPIPNEFPSDLPDAPAAEPSELESDAPAPAPPGEPFDFGGIPEASEREEPRAEAPYDPQVLPARADPASSTDASARLADLLPANRLRAASVNVLVEASREVNVNLPMTVTMTISNDGEDDVFDVVVRDPLPDHLEFVESSPPPVTTEGGVFEWRWDALAAGSEQTIQLTVKPTRPGPLDHVPVVDLRTGAKARTTVLAPKLKVEQTGPSGEVLEGQYVDFNVIVTNVGNGAARDVTLLANISGGLQGFDEEGPTDATSFERIIGTLGPSESVGPFPLRLLASDTGTQSCEVRAFSPDVRPEDDPIATSKVEITVTSPELDLAILGPSDRTVDSTADYVVRVSNLGDAPARDVRIGFYAPMSGTIVEALEASKVLENLAVNRHDIYWLLPRLDPGQSKEFRVTIRLEEIGNYIVQAATNAQGPRPYDENDKRLPQIDRQLTTQVSGIADVQIAVDRRHQVLDVGDDTVFEIRIKNVGTEDAKVVRVLFYVTKNLEVVQVDENQLSAQMNENENPDYPGMTESRFEVIDRLAQGAERVLYVRAVAKKPGTATFISKVHWEGHPEEIANRGSTFVRINPSSNTTP